MRGAPGPVPGSGERGAGKKLAPERQDLLTRQDAEQANEGDRGRRRRTHAEQAVDDPDEKPGAQSRCSSSMYCSAVIGRTPAWIMRSMARSCASSDVGDHVRLVALIERGYARGCSRRLLPVEQARHQFWTTRPGCPRTASGQ